MTQDHDVFDRLAQPYIDGLRADWAERKPTALNSRTRFSDAGSCARAIGMGAAGIEPSDGADESSMWVAAVGTAMHERVQAAWKARWPGSQFEAVGGDDLSSGHADGVLIISGGLIGREPHGAARVVAELKTMGAPAFDIAVGIWRDFRSPKRKEPKGPKVAHVLQAALNGHAHDAEEIIVAYATTDPISRKIAERLGLSERERWYAEWSFPREQWMPWAVAERNRLIGIVANVDRGELPVRCYPESFDEQQVAMIAEVDADRWPCGWCSYRSICAQLESKATVAEAVAVSVRGAA